MPSSISLEQYLKQNPKTHLLFDLDETICWLILPWEHWEDKIKSKLITLDQTIYQKYTTGKISLSELQNQYVSLFPKLKKVFIHNNEQFETTHLQKILPNSQLLKFLKTHSNSQKYTFYLWTSNTHTTAKQVLQKYALTNTFKKIITRNNVRMLKPNTEGFTLIKEKNIPLANYLFIGDSQSDKQAAHAADIDFFKINFFDQKQFTAKRNQAKVILN